jgi:hypothetical protein
MTDTLHIQTSLQRQVTHWQQAASRLSDIDHLASPYAWQGLDHSIAVQLKKRLQESIREVVSLGERLKIQLQSAKEHDSLRAVRRGLGLLRERYLKTEETIHFYTIAINSRTTPHISALLRACDILCKKSMQQLLQPLGKPTPDILTYIDKGIGASILKAGLRLWDGNVSNVAAVKITQHNLFRPTAIIHETGHQIAHILDWNEELSVAFLDGLNQHPKVISSAFASWSSEIAADAFAFVHAGYASVAALHDVVSGSPGAVFAYHANDPHPISYIRVLMNIEMCRLSFGAGPWDDLEQSFKDDYDINLVNFSSTGLVRQCVKAIPEAVKILLQKPFKAFVNRPITALIPPERVSPVELNKLENTAGPALFVSHAWIWKESLRLLALNGYKIGICKGDLSALYKQQEDWMVKLGFSIDMN